MEQTAQPWGDELEPDGEHRCNVWQGSFPDRDLGLDGWRGTCPVDAFEPNGFGLYNVCGNVWDWCADWWKRPSRRAGHPQSARSRHRHGRASPAAGRTSATSPTAVATACPPAPTTRPTARPGTWAFAAPPTSPSDLDADRQ